MQLESARSLKAELLTTMVVPLAASARAATATRSATALAAAVDMRSVLGDSATFGISARSLDESRGVHRTIALGVAPTAKKEFRLAVRVQRGGLASSTLVEQITAKAKGEVDVRIVGRIEKRASPGVPWYQAVCRPLLLGASIGHVRVTAGSIGGFVRRAGKVAVLSNNHVLANEDRAARGDIIVQPGMLDGASRRTHRVGVLGPWKRFLAVGSNAVDAALAYIDEDVAYEPARLTGILHGRNRRLVGLGAEFLDEGVKVYKVGRTTGATVGRVSAFDLDNLVITYGVGSRTFDNQLEIESADTRPFCDGGDSGSLIVDGEMRAVAQLFAGSEFGGSNNLGLTYATPIHRVLAVMQATLLH
jgi:hypothetical protein